MKIAVVCANGKAGKLITNEAVESCRSCSTFSLNTTNI